MYANFVWSGDREYTYGSMTCRERTCRLPFMVTSLNVSVAVRPGRLGAAMADTATVRAARSAMADARMVKTYA
jgi:hypothetical protein